MTGVYATTCAIQIKPKYVIPDQVHCAVIRYHSRRVTCLEFHPTKNNILLSGDKVVELNNIHLLQIFCISFLIVLFVSVGVMVHSLIERANWSLGFC